MTTSTIKKSCEHVKFCGKCNEEVYTHQFRKNFKGGRVEHLESCVYNKLIKTLHDGVMEFIRGIV